MSKKMYLLAVLVLMLLVSTFTVGMCEGKDNLVRNPSFEEISGDRSASWDTWAWKTEQGVTEFKVEESGGHSGEKFVTIINHEENDARYKQTVAVGENSIYRLSCWIKTENVGQQKTGANISLEGRVETSRDFKCTNGEWMYTEMYLQTGKGVSTINVTIGLGGYGNINIGKASFDDVVVEKVESIPAGSSTVYLECVDEKDNRQQSTGEGSGSNTGQGKPTWLLLLAGVIAATAASCHAFKNRNAKNTDDNEEVFEGDHIPDDEENEESVRSVPREKPKDSAKGESNKSPVKSAVTDNINNKMKLDRKDIIIMVCMTVIYLAVALINLGSLNVPQTLWNPANPDESFTIDLGKEADISRISYFCALGTGWSAGGSYRVEYLSSDEKYLPLTTLQKDNVFVWKCSDVSVKAHRLKIYVDSPGGALNEIGIFEAGSNEPLKDIKIIEKSLSSADKGRVENLFDEPNTIAYRPSFMNGTYFDEIYHARTAYEHLNAIEPFESTHPPLGKIFISLGIAIFGMNPFGWRVVGTLFGAAMIPIMYMFGRKLFGKRFYAFCCAFLMMFDFMHFAQTRIATIDVYVTFFVILMFYYMYDYFINKSYKLGFKQSLKPLFLSGLFFGLGTASKWIALYGAVGLAFLFFAAKYFEFRDYRSLKDTRKARKTPWIKSFIPLYINGTMVSCVLFFVIIPVVIYILSYIPFMLVPGPGHGVKEVLTYQAHMYNYHSNLEANHPFHSPWWQWPIMVKPIWFYGGSGLASGKVSTIASFGNPAVWWVGIAAAAAAICIVLWKKDKKMVVIFTAIAAQYLPWILVPRIAFIYHYFSIVPFVILCIVYVIKNLMEAYPKARYAAYIYLAVVAILFIRFYPVLSGMEVSRPYVEGLKWLKSWVF